jgi:hypothetical protein
VAVAAGLASMDMPIPNVSAWEWANWKFPKAIVAGDTIYASWTLTQKRAPVGGSRTSIAVWRVDVHTADGVICAEGEVGASVFRGTASPRQPTEPGAVVAPSRRRRRRPRGGAAEPAQPVPPAPPAAQAAERPAGTRRRRRRRTSSGNGTPTLADPGAAPAQPALPEPAVRSEAMAASPAGRANANPLSRVMKRLRRT